MAEMMHGLDFFDKVLDNTWYIEWVLFENFDGNGEAFTNWGFPNPFQNDTKGPIPDLGPELQILHNGTEQTEESEHMVWFRVWA